MRFRPRARAIRNGIVTGLLITALGAIGDAQALNAGFQTEDPSQSGLLWGALLGVGILLLAAVGYATSRRAGTVMMGGLAGAVAGFIGGLGVAVTAAWALFVPLALHEQSDSLLVAGGVGALYGVFFVAPLGVVLGAPLGMLGARVGIARRRGRTATTWDDDA